MKKFGTLSQDHIPLRNIKVHWHINVFKSSGVKKPICFAMLYFQAPFDHVTHFSLNRPPITVVPLYSWFYLHCFIYPQSSEVKKY